MKKLTRDIDISDTIDLPILISKAKKGDVSAFTQLKKAWAKLPIAQYQKNILGVESEFIDSRIAILSSELVAKYTKGSMQRDFSQLKKLHDGDDSEIERVSYDDDQQKISELKQYADAGKTKAQFAFAMIYKESDPASYYKYLQMAVLNHNTDAKFEMACAMNENVNGFEYHKLTVIRLLTEVMKENQLLIGSVYDYIEKFCKPEIKKIFYLHCLKKGLKDGFGMQTSDKSLDGIGTIFRDVISKMKRDERLQAYVLSENKTKVFTEITALLRDFSLESLIKKASDESFRVEDERFENIFTVLDRNKAVEGNKYLTASFFGGHNNSDVKMYNHLHASLICASMNPRADHIADIAESKHQEMAQTATAALIDGLKGIDGFYSDGEDDAADETAKQITGEDAQISPDRSSIDLK